MRRSLYEQLERSINLPTLPSVAIRILELCQKEELDLSQIAAVISHDPALAAKVVKTANSPLFNVRNEVSNITHAVGLIGGNAIRTLVLSFSLSKSARSVKQPGLQNYWRRSVLSAITARELCREAASNLHDEAFLGALLQDVGILALATALGPQYAKVQRAAGANHDTLIALERKNLGADHAEVGAWLLTRWNAPSMLAELVAASHEPERFLGRGSADLKLLAEIVSLSGRFADLWAKDLKSAPAQLGEELARHWSRPAISLESLGPRLSASVREVAPMFELTLDPSEQSRVLEQAQEVLVAVSVRASRELTSVQESVARLESRAATLLAETQRDPLTGVANRGYTNSYLQEAFSAATGSGCPIGLIFADVDFFKNVNDTHGHVAGDAVLKSIAQRISQAVRASDFVGRYGGEEFLIIVRSANFAELSLIAERIRAAVSESPHPIGAGPSVSATVSLGCALADPARHQTPAALVEEADRALYTAKNAGRNRCEFSLADA